MMLNDLTENSDWVSPPGDTILGLLEELELSVEDFAKKIHLPVKNATKLLNGEHAIDNNLAERLSVTIGATQKFWLAREYDYRASTGALDDKEITSFDDLIKILPLSDMKKFGWIGEIEDKEETISQSMEFFGTSTIAQWLGIYKSSFEASTYRKSVKYSSGLASTSAWLRQGELVTKYDDVADWSKDALNNEIDRFRRLTWYKCPSLFLPKLKESLARAGVKFAIVRAPKGCTASGAVRKLHDGTPHIQLSFRYLSDDQFWFSLFHELGHLILHYDKIPILENRRDAESQIETEANEYASKIIVPTHLYEELIFLGANKHSIINFAKRVGIAPGLIVGQLQHAGVISYKQMQHLKRRYQWSN